MNLFRRQRFKWDTSQYSNLSSENIEEMCPAVATALDAASYADDPAWKRADCLAVGVNCCCHRNRPHASPFVILSYFSSCRFIWMTLLFVQEEDGRN